MYARTLTAEADKSFFLFGPRGTGKSSWIGSSFPSDPVIDLLEAGLYTKLLADPGRLETFVPPDHKGWVLIDEVQKIPALLDEVHRLIEKRGWKFILTGSSARKLKRTGVNLLAGRALTNYLFPLTSQELGGDFSFEHSLRFGFLPSAYVDADPKRFLQSYVATYLKEEVEHEGLTRNIGAFSRFLEAASFSQASSVNISQVARDCSVARKIVEDYFVILEDLLLAVRLPIFTKRAKRSLSAHPKFFFFDTGVYRTIRPAGPLDAPEEIDGMALESMVFQEMRALTHYHNMEYDFFFWRTRGGLEVDFVLYGPRGIKAFEVKRSQILRSRDFTGLREFLSDYPEANAVLFYGGDREYFEGPIRVLPLKRYFTRLAELV